MFLSLSPSRAPPKHHKYAMDLDALLLAEDVPHRAHVLRRLHSHQVQTIEDFNKVTLQRLQSIFFDSIGCPLTATILDKLSALHSGKRHPDTALPAWHIESLCRTPSTATMEDVIESLSEVFDEYSIVSHRLKAGLHPWLCWDFSQRCRAAGIYWLASNVSRAARTSADPPQKMMKKAFDDQATAAPSPLRRLWPALQREASIRILMAKNALSWRSVQSGLRTWVQFCRLIGANPLPADESTILAWSSIFRNGDTFGNYISHLNTAHQIMLLKPSWDPAVLRSIKLGSKKTTIRGVKALLRHRDVVRLVEHAEAEDHFMDAILYPVAYHYLLRVPSELLPLRVATSQKPGLQKDWHSFIEFGNKAATLHLGTRKNNQDAPSRLHRQCFCKDTIDKACGVCALHKLRARATADSWEQRPFQEHSASCLARLRRRCTALGIAGASPIGLHSFRRGRASDLLAEGTSIGTLLMLGGWKSPAILSYLAVNDLENRLGAIAVIEDSDSDVE